MKTMRFTRVRLLAPAALALSLLSACGTYLLEDVADAGPPPNCAEPIRLFKNFAVQAKKISWSAPRGAAEPASTLTIDLVFENTAKWPLALSNSGDGILYSVEYTLLDGGSSRAPMQTGGIASEPYPDKPAEKAIDKPGENPKVPANVHFRMKPGQQEEEKLVFQAPRGDYVLAIERRFAGKPVAGNGEDYLSRCKISARDVSAPRPARLGGSAGVY